EDWPSQAEDAARMVELTRRAYEPIQRIIEEDPTAKAAMADLDAHRRGLFDRRPLSRPDPALTILRGPGLADPLPALHAGINVFAKPYDFIVLPPLGRQVEVHANRLT